MSKLEVYTPYMEESIALELLQDSYSFNFNKGQHGGTSMCILTGDYAVLYSNTFIANTISTSEFQKTMDLVYEIYSKDGRVAPILGYIRSADNQGIFNTYVYKKHRYRDIVIVKKAPGQALNDMRGYKQMVDKIHERLRSSKEHYDEIVKTLLGVLNSGVKPDISRNNIMFESKSGFTLVDFNGLEKMRGLDEEGKKRLYFKYHITRFLKSFVTDKNFWNEEMKAEYFKTATVEQQILCEKLFRAGVCEEILEYAISAIVDLESPTLDKLYGKPL